MKLDTKAFEDKMKKTIAVLEEEFACIRIGRARVLDKITVPYYGADGRRRRGDREGCRRAHARHHPLGDEHAQGAGEGHQASDIGITPQKRRQVPAAGVSPALTEAPEGQYQQTAKMGEAKVAVPQPPRTQRQNAKKEEIPR